MNFLNLYFIVDVVLFINKNKNKIRISVPNVLSASKKLQG